MNNLAGVTLEVEVMVNAKVPPLVLAETHKKRNQAHSDAFNCVVEMDLISSSRVLHQLASKAFDAAANCTVAKPEPAAKAISRLRAALSADLLAGGQLSQQQVDEVITLALARNEGNSPD